MMRNAMMFVDQENLRNGCNNYDPKYQYAFVKLRNELVEDYYTIRSYWYASWNPENDKPTGFYDALRGEGFRVCASPRKQRGKKKYEEKGVDIQLATDLIAQAYQESYDTAVVVSGDADYRRAIEYVQDQGKRVIAAGWKNSSSKDIKRQADEFIELNDIADAIKK